MDYPSKRLVGKLLDYKGYSDFYRKMLHPDHMGYLFFAKKGLKELYGKAILSGEIEYE